MFENYFSKLGRSALFQAHAAVDWVTMMNENKDTSL